MNLSHQVTIPIDRIQERLLQCAVPGFWGEVSIEVQVLPRAAEEVCFSSERKTTTLTDCVKQTEPIGSSSERSSLVRNKVAELGPLFRLECPLARMRATFRDGKLVSVELTDRIEIPPAGSGSVGAVSAGR